MRSISDFYPLEYVCNGDVEMLGKFKVALISTWHCHDCTSTIASKNIVSNPNGYFFSTQGMNGIAPCKNTCDVLDIRHSISFRSIGALFDIAIDFSFVIRSGDAIYQIVFGC